MCIAVEKDSDLDRNIYEKTAVLIVLLETSVFLDMVTYSHNTMCLFPEKILFSFHLILIDQPVIPELNLFAAYPWLCC